MSEYRYKNFTTRLLFRDLRFRRGAAGPGRAMISTQSNKLIGPVARAMGMVREVMKRGGPQAVSDLWRAGFPMALGGLVATFFKPLSPDQRGIAAVLTLAVGMLLLLGLLLTLFFN